MADNTLTKVKDKFGIAYLQMLSAHCKYKFVDLTGTDKDDSGVDCEVYEDEFMEIKFQVKVTAMSSLSMIEEDDNYLYYNLDKKKYRPNHKRYLALIIMPNESDFDNWLKTDYNFDGNKANQFLLLKATAYFLELNGDYQTGKTLNSKGNNKVKIPKNKILNKDSLKKIIDKLQNPESFI